MLALIVMSLVTLQAPARMSEAERKRNYDNWEWCVNVKAGDDLDRAIAACTELLPPSIPLKPEERALVYAKRGVIRSRKHLWEGAVEDLTIALPAIEPSRRNWVLLERGLALTEINRRIEGIRDITEMLATEPAGSDDQTRALFGRALTNYQIQEYARAIPDLDILIASRPPHAMMLFLRGAARQRTGQAAAGQADLDAAARLDPAIETKMKVYAVTPLTPALPPAAAGVSSAPSGELASLVYNARLHVELTKGMAPGAQRTRDIEAGLDLTAKLLRLDPENVEGLTYRGLLLRFKASDSKSPAEQQALLAEAEALRVKAEAIRKRR